VPRYCNCTVQLQYRNERFMQQLLLLLLQEGLCLLQQQGGRGGL
jgi:hypothetical protein